MLNNRSQHGLDAKLENAKFRKLVSGKLPPRYRLKVSLGSTAAVQTLNFQGYGLKNKHNPSVIQLIDVEVVRLA